MAANGYAPTSSSQVVASGQAQTVAISGTTLRIVNIGPNVAYVAFGTSTPVTVTPQTGLAIEPNNPPEFITVGSNTYMGVITDATTFTARLNVSLGA
jgi:hypothetical protein